MIKPTPLLLGGLLAAALAGCGAQPTTNETTVGTPVPGNELVQELPVETVPADTAVANAADNAAAPIEAAIPAALHGRWGLVPEDCTSTRGDAKGLLVVDATTLRFYESRATLGTVAEQDASRLVADFAFSGEGQSWTRRQVLDVQDQGKTLIRREQGADAMAGVLRYRRCA